MTRRETGEKNKVVEESQKSNRGDYGSKYVESGEKREKKWLDSTGLELKINQWEVQSRETAKGNVTVWALTGTTPASQRGKNIVVDHDCTISLLILLRNVFVAELWGHPDPFLLARCSSFFSIILKLNPEKLEHSWQSSSTGTRCHLSVSASTGWVMTHQPQVISEGLRSQDNYIFHMLSVAGILSCNYGSVTKPFFKKEKKSL